VTEVTVSSHHHFLSSYDLASFTTGNADLELIYKIYSNDNSAPLNLQTSDVLWLCLQMFG
jgi:hypothetical protein